MSDLDHDEEFSKAFEGFGEDPATTSVPTADPPKKDDESPTPEPSKAPEEVPKQDEQSPEPKKSEEEPPKKTETDPSATDASKKEEEPKSTEEADPKKSEEVSEESKPLTKEDVTSIISNMRNEEVASGKQLENTTQEVIEAYYPEGLSNVLTDEKTGKQLRTPQDVVEASGGEMSTEEAAQWLMNEQYKLDQDVARIKEDARKVAETTINFKRDSISALQKYEPLFKEYPYLQKKVFDKLMKQVKYDQEKGVILSAPDVLEHYDDYLEPYQLAFEHSKGAPATNPTPPPNTETPPAKPSADDRLDEGGDGGATTEVDDPNDFNQQVRKELVRKEN